MGLLKLDGSGVKLIDRAPVDVSDLTWSPCGTWLAYVIGTQGTTNSVIRIYNAVDGLGPFDVTSGRFQVPDWQLLLFLLTWLTALAPLNCVLCRI